LEGFEPSGTSKNLEENSSQISEPGILVSSSFLRGSFFHSWTECLNKNWNAERGKSSPILAFVQPFVEILGNYSPQTLPFVSIQVVKSFAPSLGFGSSSAILAACLQAAKNLEKSLRFANSQNCNFPIYLFQKLTLADFSFHQILKIVHAVQGKGSGYDVLAQLHSTQVCMAETLNVEMSAHESYVFCSTSKEILKKFEWPSSKNLNLGSIWATHIYSPTAKIIAADRKSMSIKIKDSVEFFLKNGCEEKKEKWSLKPSEAGISALKNCVEFHLSQIRGNGLDQSFGSETQRSNSAFSRILDAFQTKPILFKTTGAGCGDSLWVLQGEEYISTLPWTDFGFSACPVEKIATIG
jgi:mevalonate kinase